ncbi:MAG: hypothetical protein JWO88_3792 [Frankiales bacterium]|nr:hypothetical protein [Frankiales bacterium]
MADLETLAFGNYGHYTSMQVRAGAVRGLDLHLDRLEANSGELFGGSPSRERVLRAMRHALPASGNCSMRVTVFTHELRRVFAGEPIEPDLMVSTTPPVDADLSPLRVLPLPYQREMPQVKHLATYGLLRALRAARDAGYDDALFVDASGRVSEGTTWNVCFYDGDQWLWPEAAVLQGVTMQLLRGALQEAGLAVGIARIPAAELHRMRAAFASNSVTPSRPISAIGDQVLSPQPGPHLVLNELFDDTSGTIA